MESGSAGIISTCMLRQIEDVTTGLALSTAELYLDDNFAEAGADFFQGGSLLKVFSKKDSSLNMYSCNEMDAASFLSILSSLKGMGWTLLCSNAYASDSAVVVKCFYFDKAIAGAPRDAQISHASPSRVPPVPARRNSRTPTSMAVDCSNVVIGIAGNSSPIKINLQPAPPPVPSTTRAATSVLQADSLEGLTRDRITIDSGKRAKPAGKTSKALLLQLAASRKNSFLNTVEDSAVYPQTPNKRPPLSPTVSVSITKDIIDLPLSPIKQGDAMGAAHAAFVPRIDSSEDESAVASHSAQPPPPPQRRKSLRAPPFSLKTSLTAEDMQDTPYVTPSMTAPAAAQSTTVSSISPRTLRPPPPIPRTPDNKIPPRRASHFTFDELPIDDASIEEQNSVNQTMWPPSPVEQPEVEVAPKRTTRVGNSYRSILKSFQAKNKPAPQIPDESSPVAASAITPAVPAEKPPPPPLPHAASMGDELLKQPPENNQLPRSASNANDIHSNAEALLSSNNSASSVTLPDEKNIHFYERNLQFFKKLKEVLFIFVLYYLSSINRFS